MKAIMIVVTLVLFALTSSFAAEAPKATDAKQWSTVAKTDKVEKKVETKKAKKKAKAKKEVKAAEIKTEVKK